MSNLFHGYYTAEDIKGRYRQLAKEYHPDKPGGSKEKFQYLQKEYEEVLQRAEREVILPALYKPDGIYEYFKKKVRYRTRDTHWYWFDIIGGCNLRVDKDHIYLIKEEYKKW